jgi:opacity protein-like surface antigen
VDSPGGGQFGYNYQIQSILLGAEADLGYTGISGSRSFLSIRYHNPYAQMIDSKWLTTFRGRLGFVDGMWLGYVTGGLAVANVSSTDRFIGEHGAGIWATMDRKTRIPSRRSRSRQRHGDRYGQARSYQPRS